MRRVGTTLGLSLAIVVWLAAAPALAEQEFQCVSGNDRCLVTAGDTRVTDSDVTVNEGNLLMLAKHDATIQVHGLNVAVDKGSMVLVKATKDAVIVRDLLDPHSGAVKITSAGKTIKLTVGQELVLSTTEAGKQVACADGIGRRSVRQYNDPALGHVAVADINLQDNLVNEPALVFFRRANDVPEHDKIVSRLIKTTAIYSMLIGSASPYQRSSLSR